MRQFIFSFLYFSFLSQCILTQAQTIESSSLASTGDVEKYNPSLSFSVRRESDSELPTKVTISLKEIQKEVTESTFVVEKHPVYEGRSVTYLGFDFKDVIGLLAKKLEMESTDGFVFSLWASDNFSAFVSNEDLKQGHAFLAWREIGSENPNKTPNGLWTMVPQHGDPGPFYLVWNNPETTYWKKWPFKIADITLVSATIVNKFDSIKPDDDFMRTKGYRLVVNNCTSCHKISGVGFGDMGPDLAVMAKFRSEADFVKQIRTPNPLSRMISFKPSALSDDDIKAVYQYLTTINGK